MDTNVNGDFLLAEQDEFIIDPSFLLLLMSHKVNRTSEYKLFIPDNLQTLIEKSETNYKYREFLSSFLRYFSYSRSLKIGESEWDLFYKNYHVLIESNRLQAITSDDIDKEVYESTVEKFTEHPFYTSFSPEVNILGDIIGKILSCSKKTRKAILMKTRRLSYLLREKISVLEIPPERLLSELLHVLSRSLDHADSMVEAKGSLMRHLFDFHGGKTVKIFIGVTLSIGGFIHPLLGMGGLIFTFFDP